MLKLIHFIIVQNQHNTAVCYFDGKMYACLKSQLTQSIAGCDTQTASTTQTEYFHTDLNGAPLDVTDEAGNIVWCGKYNAWGTLRPQVHLWEKAPGLPRQPLRYAGQYCDDETGLHYNLFRYYDPDVGRFTGQDPIGLAGGINFYQYAVNPQLHIDPLGLWTVKIGRYVIRVHANDVDPWSSMPHGHIYDDNSVIDKNGNIFKAHGGPQVDTLSKKELKLWKQELKKTWLLK